MSKGDASVTKLIELTEAERTLFDQIVWDLTALT